MRTVRCGPRSQWRLCAEQFSEKVGTAGSKMVIWMFALLVEHGGIQRRYDHFVADMP